jgi:hypothetical protein
MIGGSRSGEGIADHCRKTRALPSSTIPALAAIVAARQAAPVNNRQNTGARLYRASRNAPMERISGMAAEYPIRPESVRRCMAASDTAGPDIPMESAETITFTPPFENEDVISGQEICQAKSDIIVQKRDFINL